MAIPLNELMKEIDGLLGEANEELEDLINKSSTIDLTLPDFEKASCKKVLYDNYARVVNFNGQCAQSIMKINKLLLTIKDIQNQIVSSDAYNYNIIQQFNMNIKVSTQKVKDNLTNVQDFKNSMDAILKFYNNLSFILTSPYLRDNI
jgi:parvulin-like peptidyl-prolyl isomerase